MHAVEDFLLPRTIRLLKKQGYYLFGHSAVKSCHYTKQALRGQSACYKQKFYGIRSHQCIQMSPASSFCDQKCRYCWRPIQTFFPQMDLLKSQKAKKKNKKSKIRTPKLASKTPFDSPAEIVSESIKGQSVQLSGFGGFSGTDKEKLVQSKNPRHAALSLTGEPTLFPLLPELLSEFHKNKISTFLVSNGLHPEMLKRLKKNPPTQFYISLDSPLKEIHLKLNNPDFSDSWERLNKSLQLLHTIPTRTVVRITCVKGINMNHPREFAQLIEKARPDFVEVKGYVHVGFSRYRLGEEAMPSFAEVQKFALEINKHLKYFYKNSDRESFVVLLVHPKWKNKSTIIDFEKLFSKAKRKRKKK